MRLLELNDAGLRLFALEGEVPALLADSPGCAALDGRQLVVGDHARRRARLDPRRAHDRFWYQLDAPLGAALGPARSAADLAHAHLSSLREDLCAEPLIIAAPGSFTPAQLGVLLGLLQSLGLRAEGLVDSAVAAVSSVEAPGAVLHVDVQLHRVVVTSLRGDTQWQRERVDEHKPGLIALQDRAAAVIAQAFVRHARFDPLHNAGTEQSLYDRLQGWMETLSQASSAMLELPAAGRSHRVSLTREVLEQALAERVDALADVLLPAAHSQRAAVLLSARAAAIPGLAMRLAPARTLAADAAARGVREHQSLLRSADTELPWVTRLPRRASSHAETASPLGATHALIGTHARALPGAGRLMALSSLMAGAPGQLHHRDGSLRLEHAAGSALRLNGAPLREDCMLGVGDRLSLGAMELRLIVVETAA